MRLGPIIIAFFLAQFSFSQQLMINEVSQGPGSSEYVEFLVAGTPSCASPVPCLDLRKVIIDDNNGYFASGTGTGIAAGAVRFANNSFWQCVPQGTLILIYNDVSPNPAVPPIDQSMTDGNCTLILPASSNLFEKTTVSPTTSSTNYPPDASWTVGGSWNPLAMSNTDDSFQLPNPISGTPSHAVSWGNNTNGSIIYFNGSAAGKVFSMLNTVSSNWNLQANWGSGQVPANETPGVPNSAANQAWIGAMNPNCGLGMDLTLSSDDETCINACDGMASSSVANGQAPYTYLWSNGATTATINGLCAGTYTLEVTGANGCSLTEQVVVQSGLQNPDATIAAAGPFLSSNQAVQLNSTTLGGIWSSDCGSCLSASGLFSPQIAGVGIFTICYTLGSGACSDQDCITIQVIQDCLPQLTSETITICPFDSLSIFGNWISIPGNYSQSYVDINGCDSTHTIILQNFNVHDEFESIPVCELDSISLFGTYYFSDTLITQQQQTVDGCVFQHTIQLVFSNCEIEPFVIYIPNVFTPNNDLVNDDFTIQILGGQVEEGYVFNRWGEIVHVFDVDHLSWDGHDKKSGAMVMDGVYTYLLYVKPAETPRESIHGFVTVIR